MGADWAEPGILDRARSLFASVIDSLDTVADQKDVDDLLASLGF